MGVGLVGSLTRPGGNLTGVSLFATEPVAKRLGLVSELVPGVVESRCCEPHVPIAEATLRRGRWQRATWGWGSM